MTTPYTQTPWRYARGCAGGEVPAPYCQIYHDGTEMIIADVNDCVSGDLADANGRLAISAVNSYATHFGDRAIEAAEADLLGEAILRLRDCVDSLEYVNRNHPDISGGWVRQERIENAKALLSRIDAP